MKPDWKDAPEWANWLAMDEDGYWYWYELEPSPEPVLRAWIVKEGSRFGNTGHTEIPWLHTKEHKRL